MAIWTNPTTRVTEERISQSIWNTDLVENLKFLYDSLVSTTTTITRVAVDSGSPAASIDVQNIVQTGRNIKITGFLRPATDDMGLFLRLNNHSGASDYAWQTTGTSAGLDAADSEIELINSAAGALLNVGNAVDEFCWFNLTIPGYKDVIGSLPHGIVGEVGWRNANGGGPSICHVAGSLLIVEAINRVTLLFESGNITEGVVYVEVTRP